jgi:hypothetical protein
MVSGGNGRGLHIDRWLLDDEVLAEYVAHRPRLVELDLSGSNGQGTGMGELHGRKGVTHLRCLLKDGKATLPMLTKLVLNLCENLEDISPVAVCTSLTSVDLGFCNKVTDISALSPHALPALKSVDLRSCINLKGIEALGGEALGGSVLQANKSTTKSYQRGRAPSPPVGVTGVVVSSSVGAVGSAVGSLSALSLMRVPCEDEWLQYLPTGLQTVNLSYCSLLTDGAIEALKRSNPGVRIEGR